MTNLFGPVLLPVNAVVDFITTVEHTEDLVRSDG